MFYESLSPELEQQILDDRRHGYTSPFAASDSDCIRRKERPSDVPKIYRLPYSKDADKILNSAFYKHRCSHSSGMMTSRAAHFMCSWSRALRGTSARCWG